MSLVQHRTAAQQRAVGHVRQRCSTSGPDCQLADCSAPSSPVSICGAGRAGQHIASVPSCRQQKQPGCQTAQLPNCTAAPSSTPTCPVPIQQVRATSLAPYCSRALPCRAHLEDIHVLPAVHREQLVYCHYRRQVRSLGVLARPRPRRCTVAAAAFASAIAAAAAAAVAHCSVKQVPAHASGKGRSR